MATYEEIYGKRVKDFDSDPTLDSSYEGQVWYDKSTGVLKSVVVSDSVSSKPGIIRGTTSSNQMGSFSGGSADAMAVFGGNPPTPSGSNATEEFNGSGWSNTGNMNNSLFNRSGFGTLTAGVAYGGRVPPGTSNTTEHYNGSTWTAANAMPEVIRGGAGGGPQTAGIVFGGHANPTYPIASNKTKYYNGTNWSVQPATMNTSRANMSGCGTQTAALAASGEPGPGTVTESYDGTSWTTVNSLNTARANQGPAVMQGSSASATMLGGNPPYPSASRAIEGWDGTSWATSPASLVSQGVSQSAGQGSSSSTVSVFGGSAGSSLAEQFNKSINTITAAAWASSTVYPTPNSYLAGFGVLNAGVAAGGDGPPGNGIATTAEYDGSSWTAGGDLGTGRRGLGSGTNSTLTAGLVFGGNNPGVPTQYALVEEYNGSSWSEVTNLPGNQSNVGGFGTQTAGACLPVSATATLEYDGTNWSSAGSLSTPRSNTLGIGCGTQTAGLCVGGGPSGPVAGDTEEYNGTAWTAGGDYIRAIQFQGSAGIQTSALISGGGPGSNTDCGGYDGTAFSTRPAMSTGREAHCGGIGSATNTTGLAVTGRTSPRSNAVEEFTGETTGISSSTLTTS